MQPENPQVCPAQSDSDPVVPPGDTAPSVILRPASWVHVLPLSDVFDPSRPLEVDVGCGKGRFLLARALRFPDHNFLGIDRLVVRLGKVDRRIVRQSLPNVRLLRMEAWYAIAHLLPPESVTCFYVFFPDPWPKRRHHGRRLFTADFLTSLHRALRDDGQVHVATDHTDYLAWIQKAFALDPRFERIEPFVPQEDERTDFERIFSAQGLPIGRCSYRKVSTSPGGSPRMLMSST